MEIQCPKCASRFNLPGNLKQSSVKLRCSICKTVFPYSLESSDSKQPVLQSQKSKNFAKKLNSKAGLIVFTLILCLSGGTFGYYWQTKHTPPPKQEDIAQKLAQLTMRNVRQYYVDNEKIGRLMVIEGKVVNEFPQPKALIAVEAAIYDKNKKNLSVKKQTAGTQLSLFQLQVLSEKEMESFLNNKMEILSNNLSVPQGGEVPFMILFYSPPQDVAEFGVRIVDVQDAETQGK